MAASAVGVIFSNIHDENIPELSRHRTMASIPYGGSYGWIDFALRLSIPDRSPRQRKRLGSCAQRRGDYSAPSLFGRNGRALFQPFGSVKGNYGLFKPQKRRLRRDIRLRRRCENGYFRYRAIPYRKECGYYHGIS